MNKWRYLVICLIIINCYAKDPFLLPKKPPLTSTTISIHYTNIKKLIEKITSKKSHLLSPAGSAIADDSTHQIWVFDTTAHQKKIRRFIQAFDRPIPQIKIKARILLIDDNSLKKLGAMIHSSQHITNGLTVPLLTFNHINLLDLTINALEEKGHVVVISSPELVTSNQHTAIIESGEAIPYQEKTGDGNTSTSFKKAVLRLEVTPTIINDHKILLTLTINEDKPSELIFNGSPAINTQSLHTQVIISNNKTLVLGGIREQTHQQHNSHTPWLYHIPLLKLLFQNKTNHHSNKQLLIFITPQIVS